MDFLLSYWYVIVGIIAVLVMTGFAIYKFAGLPTKEQISKIKEWLLYAVIKTESELGSGTGKIKLRAVYDKFVGKFPVVANLINFKTFSKWVDSALEEMRKILKENEAIKTLVDTKSI